MARIINSPVIKSMSKQIIDKPHSALINYLCKKHSCEAEKLLECIVEVCDKNDLIRLHENGYYIPYRSGMFLRSIRYINAPMIKTMLNTSNATQREKYLTKGFHSKIGNAMAFVLMGADIEIYDDSYAYIERYIDTVDLLVDFFGSEQLFTHFDQSYNGRILDRVSKSATLTKYLLDKGLKIGSEFRPAHVRPEIMQLYIDYGGDLVANQTTLEYYSYWTNDDSYWLLLQEVAVRRRKAVMLACYSGEWWYD